MSFLAISIKASPYHALWPKELAVGACPDLWGGGQCVQSLQIFLVLPECIRVLEYIVDKINKLASLEATLVQNYDRLTDGGEV